MRARGFPPRVRQEATPSPVVAEASVEAPGPVQEPEPLPPLEELLEDVLPDAPPPPSSYIRAVRTRCDEAPEVRYRWEHVRSGLVIAEDLDSDRAFDRAIFWMLQDGHVDAESIEAMRYCHALWDFIWKRVGGWTSFSKRRLRSISSHRLWDSNGIPTELGEEVWRLFRIRIRREGALDKILTQRIARKPDSRVA